MTPSTDMGTIGVRGPGGWTRTGDGHWRQDDGSTISRVNPRGKVLYALVTPRGARSPRFPFGLSMHDTLAQARRAWESDMGTRDVKGPR